MATIVSWFTASPPNKDGSRHIVEHHIVGGQKHTFEWECHRRIDPQIEVNRRALRLAAEIGETRVVQQS